MALITKEDFASLMQVVCPKDEITRVAVACSGGPDSMALACLARVWAAETDAFLTAIIVDHRLRDDSTLEASLVKSRLEENGIDAHILTREGEGKITRDIQNQARQIRYQLLEQFCLENDIQTLLTAHHQEDQAETFLLRLARGSGVDGLSAMKRLGALGALQLARPLLDVSKVDILETLDAFGVEAVNDPSNANEDFDRVKMRNRQSLFDEVGLTTKRLADTAKNMARARSALAQMTDTALQCAASLYPEGYCKLDGAKLILFPEEIALRSLSRILRDVGGRDYPPRLEQVERLYENIASNNLAGGCTLAGCGVVPKHDGLLFFRENAAVTDTQNIAASMLWDGRYKVFFDTVDDALTLKKLGANGWQKLKQVVDKDSDFPAVVRNTLPAIWRGDDLLSVPHIQGAQHSKNFGLAHISFIAGENF